MSQELFGMDKFWQHPVPVAATQGGVPELGAEVGMWQGGRRGILFLGGRRGSFICNPVCGAA